MSPRPRKASDDQIFAAAHAVISRLGPAQWTLADVAAEAGLTAGALVQRFGSKRALMARLTAQLADAPPQLFADLRSRHPSPLAALRAYADCVAGMAETPAALAHHLAYLQLDFMDAELRQHVARQARATRAALAALIREAIGAGEIVPTADAATLARAVEVTLGGSLLAWGFHQEGRTLDWVRQDFERLIEPYLAARGRGRSRRSAAGARRRAGQR